MELIIEGLKSYHNSKFIDDMISFNNENNEIYFIDDGKTAIIKVSVLLNNRFAGLLGRLEFNCPRSYYYDDDDLDNYWTMTKTQATNQEIIDKLNDNQINYMLNFVGKMLNNSVNSNSPNFLPKFDTFTNETIVY